MKIELFNTMIQHNILKTVSCNIMKYSLSLVLLLHFVMVATLSAEVIDSSKISSLYSANSTINQITSLHTELEDIKKELKYQKETQERIYNVTMNRLSWEYNIIIGLIVIITLIIGFFGLKIVRRIVDDAVEKSISKLSEERISQKVEELVTKKLSDWDKKFAEKYKELSKLVETQKKRLDND